MHAAYSFTTSSHDMYESYGLLDVDTPLDLNGIRGIILTRLCDQPRLAHLHLVEVSFDSCSWKQ